jgi:hypothetical protein
MLGAASSHHFRADALIERRQPSTVGDREREQINVGDLRMPLQAAPINNVASTMDRSAGQNT